MHSIYCEINQLRPYRLYSLQIHQTCIQIHSSRRIGLPNCHHPNEKVGSMVTQMYVQSTHTLVFSYVTVSMDLVLHICPKNHYCLNWTCLDHNSEPISQHFRHDIHVNTIHQSNIKIHSCNLSWSHLSTKKNRRDRKVDKPWCQSGAFPTVWVSTSWPPLLPPLVSQDLNGLQSTPIVNQISSLYLWTCHAIVAPDALFYQHAIPPWKGENQEPTPIAHWSMDSIDVNLSASAPCSTRLILSSFASNSPPSMVVTHAIPPAVIFTVPTSDTSDKLATLTTKHKSATQIMGFLIIVHSRWTGFGFKHFIFLPLEFFSFSISKDKQERVINHKGSKLCRNQFSLSPTITATISWAGKEALEKKFFFYTNLLGSISHKLATRCHRNVQTSIFPQIWKILT